MSAYLERITVFCFAASYTVALILELVRLWRPYPALRLLSLGFGGAGLVAHTLFVAVQRLPLATPFGSLLFLAWILAVFYLYGSLHHRSVAWGIFVLPLVLGLIVLAELRPAEADAHDLGLIWDVFSFRGEKFWGLVHGCLLLLAGVGICVGFVASVMYLVQLRRLKAKVPPGRGVRLFSLERLEGMNRRALVLSFPLLTAGILVGAALLLHNNAFAAGWLSSKILSAMVLWLLFALVVYLRYAAGARGRHVAVLTILAFALLVLSFAAPPHPFVLSGDGP
jgi:ABC-type transport system involved in cytochrome c biogenesis permease subunit